MAAAGSRISSPRFGRAEYSRLARAVLLSLAVHLLISGTWYVGKKFHVWERWTWPAWMQSPKMLTQLLPKKQRPVQEPESQVPTVFVEVSPSQATTEEPKTTRYYSTRNSLASNPDPDKGLDIPKISGTQEEVVRTENIAREKLTALKPVLPAQPVPPPQPQTQTEPQPEEKARPAEPEGDLTLVKPDPKPPSEPKSDGEARQSRPRTIKEALERRSRLSGQKLKQEGGVARRSEAATLDAKSSLFGEYDEALIQAIQDRWYALLDERDYASDVRGRVVLRFSLHPDGRISDLSISENSVGEMLSLICQKAVLDPQPYAAWPIEMRRVFGETRHIQFTFYYR